MRSLASSDAVSAAGTRLATAVRRLGGCVVIAAMGCSLLPGCGQKGPLRLPAPLTSVTPAASAASATAPTGFPSASPSR